MTGADLDAVKAMLVDALKASHDAPWAITREAAQIGSRRDVDAISVNVNGGEYFEHFDADKLAAAVLDWFESQARPHCACSFCQSKRKGDQ